MPARRLRAGGAGSRDRWDGDRPAMAGPYFSEGRYGPQHQRRNGSDRANVFQFAPQSRRSTRPRRGPAPPAPCRLGVYALAALGVAIVGTAIGLRWLGHVFLRAAMGHSIKGGTVQTEQMFSSLHLKADAVHALGGVRHHRRHAGSASTRWRRWESRSLGRRSACDGWAMFF